jgi:tetratricopeptide (TPR) repeat protein
VLEDLLERRPRDPEAHFTFAQFLLVRGEGDAAVAHLERAAAEGIDPPTLLGRLIEVQYALGRGEDAARTSERLESEHPGHPVTERARSQQLIADGRYSEAAERLRADIAREESAAALALLAVAEHGAGNTEAAQEAIERAISLAPTARLHALRGRIRADAGDCGGALEDFKRAVGGGQRLDRTDELKIAWCLYETGRELQGRDYLERMMMGDDPDHSALLVYASQEARRDPHRALEWLTRATATGEAAPRIRLARAELLAKMGRLEEAQAEAEAVFAESPRETGAFHVLAAISAARGEVASSIATLEQRQRAGPLTPTEAYFLAVLYDGAGDAARAKAAYEHAVSLEDAVPQAKNNLAYLLAKEGAELDRALRLAREAVRELSEAPELLDTLGYVYYRMGRDGEAAEQFRLAIEAAPEGDRASAYYHYHLGLVRKRMGRERIAARSFERALAIDPDFPEAERVRALAEEAR